MTLNHLAGRTTTGGYVWIPRDAIPGSTDWIITMDGQRHRALIIAPRVADVNFLPDGRRP